MQATVPAYLQSWSLELSARANRVRQLIGDAHWLSDGHHKEELLRDFLARYMPRDLLLARGFVKSTVDLSLCSPEVDILVSDPSLNPPLFSEGGLQIVDASSVLALLEIKTTFSKAKLKEAVLSAARTLSLINRATNSRTVYSLVHFYAGQHSADAALTSLNDSLSEVAALGRREGWFRPNCLPNSVSVIGEFAIFLTNNDNNEVDCRLFEAKHLSTACVLADLLGHIRRVRGGASMGGLDDVVESIQFSQPVRRKVLI